MNKRIKKKWVAALESGKYKQTRGYLKNEKGGGYCCLGVLCDLYCKEKKVTQDSVFTERETLLPFVVREWACLPDGMPDTKSYRTRKGGVANLADLNDGRKMNFKQIAEVIKKDF